MPIYALGCIRTHRKFNLPGGKLAKQNVSRKWREMLHMLYIANMAYIEATRF